MLQLADMRTLDGSIQNLFIGKVTSYQYVITWVNYWYLWLCRIYDSGRLANYGMPSSRSPRPHHIQRSTSVQSIAMEGKSLNLFKLQFRMFIQRKILFYCSMYIHNSQIQYYVQDRTKYFVLQCTRLKKFYMHVYNMIFGK